MNAQKIQFHYGDKVIINPSCTLSDPDLDVKGSAIERDLTSVRDNGVVGVVETHMFKFEPGAACPGGVPVHFPDLSETYVFNWSELLPAPTPAPQATEVWYTVIIKHADEPEMDTEEWREGVPTGYGYLSPLLQSPDFVRVEFVTGLTRTTIFKME